MPSACFLLDDIHAVVQTQLCLMECSEGPDTRQSSAGGLQGAAHLPPPALALAECLAGEAEVSLKLTVTRMWNEDEL